jgi:acetyl esterase/lipase
MRIPKVSLAVLAAFVAACSTPQVKPPVESATYGFDQDILYLAAGELSDYQRERCRLDIYYPRDAAGYATVVWFHGGGLKRGHKEIPPALRDKGIAVVAVNYRLSPRVGAPAYIDDAAAAVAWTFENIEKFGGSRDRIFVSGHSAGGYLTDMIGLDERWLAKYGVDADDIAGLIPFSGQSITHFTVREERGIEGNQPVVDDLAPLFHVRKNSPPMLLITGDRESELLGRYEETAYMWRMLQEVGHPRAELIELQGFNHNDMPGPAYPLMLEFINQVNP